MKISHLYESTMIFGGLHYNYQHFDVEGDIFNFINFINTSGTLNIHLSNNVSTPVSFDEILVPSIVYESAEHLHQIIEGSLKLVVELIPQSMKMKDVKCWYLLHSDDLDVLEKDMKKFKSDLADVEIIEQTKFGGQRFCKFLVTFRSQ